MSGFSLRGLPPERTLLIALAVLAALLLVALLLQLRRGRLRARDASDARGQLGAVTATMREGVIVYDMQRRLIRVNPAFERLTGYAEEDVRDQEFLQYIHSDDRSALLAEWDRLERGGVLRDQEYRVVTRAGQVRWCASTWETLRDKVGRRVGFLGTEYDITERKLAEEELRRDAELFQAVIEVQQAVAGAGLDSATVMRVIAERSKGLTGASGAVIEVLDGEDIIPQVVVGTEAPRLKVATSLSGLCVRTGELQRSDDVFIDERISHDAYRALGIQSLLAVPLSDDQRTLGVLKVVAPQPDAFTERDAKALQLLAGLAGAALGHAAAFEARQARLEDRTRALQDSEQRFKQLVDAAQEGIWVSDDRGMITYVNQRMVELLGYQNGAMLGRPVLEFIDAASRDGAQKALHGARIEGRNERPPLPPPRWRGALGTGLRQPDRGTRRLGGGLGGHGHRHHRAQAGGRPAAPHGGTAHRAARSRPLRPGRAVTRRDRARRPGPHPPDGAVPALQRAALRPGPGQAQMLAGYADNIALPATVLPIESLSPIEVLRHGAVRNIEDLGAVETPPPVLHQLRGEGMRSVLSVPLLVDGEAIGEINLASRTPKSLRQRASRHRAGDRRAARHRDPARTAARGAGPANRRARNGGSPRAVPRCGRPPRKPTRCCTPSHTTCATRFATSAASPTCSSSTAVLVSSRAFATMPSVSAKAPTGWRTWWIIW